jgi:tetratricopeptide (TPR) repeat protein
MMVDRKRRKITRRAESRRHFLLSQTDSRKVDDAPLVGAEPVRSALAEVFPGLLGGADFAEAALQQVGGGERPFCALVIRPDDPIDIRPQAPGVGALAEIAAGLDEICRGAGGLWGVAESGLLAGLWPAASAAEGLKAAGLIQEQVRRRTGRTVTIGVAVHPTLDFLPRAAIENAHKAAEHAAFFGPDSRVTFDAVSLNISGDKCYERGDIHAAIHEFQQALRLDPQNANVHNSLGVCYGLLGEHARALEAFARALALEGGDYMAVYNTGLIHGLQGRREEALAHFLRASTLHGHGDVFEILFQTGKLQLELGDLPSACHALERAVRLRPRSGNALRLLGDGYVRLQLPQKAIRAYQRAVKANPADSLALSALGQLFDEKGENSEIALLFCKESVRLAPDNPTFRKRLGRLYFKLNRLEAALKEFEQAERLGQECGDDMRRVRERLEEKN